MANKDKKKKAADKVKEVEETKEDKVVDLPVPGRPMTEVQAREYLNKLMGGHTPSSQSLEIEAYKQFITHNNQLSNGTNQLRQMTEQIEGLKKATHELQGRTDAYANLLIAAENERLVAQKKEE